MTKNRFRDEVVRAELADPYQSPQHAVAPRHAVVRKRSPLLAILLLPFVVGLTFFTFFGVGYWIGDASPSRPGVGPILIRPPRGAGGTFATGFCRSKRDGCW
jgi:hypothetical protein